MSELTGTPEKIPVVSLGPGEAHLQNVILSDACYLCKKIEDDMVLIRIKEKQLGYACLDHAGVIQEFIRQYGRLPLGWVRG